MRWVFIAIFGAAGLTVALLGFRGDLSRRPPRIVFWDMKFQAKYLPQSRSAFFADGRTMRTPVAGTVAYAGPDYFSDAGYLAGPNPEFLREDDVFYRGRQGDAFVERLPQRAVDEAGGWRRLFERGREQYTLHCAVCHGRTGAGNGPTTVYGMVGVASYHDDRLRQMPDGELYNTIVNGKNTMPAYGHQVPRALDRWAVVAYVRALQLSQAASLEDVPAPQRAKLGSE